MFDQQINNDIKTFGNIRKIATGQGDDYKTGFWLDYSYFRDNYKMIAIDLNKHQAYNVDFTVIQQINCTGNLDRAGNTTRLNVFHDWRRKINCLGLFSRNCKSIANVL